MTQNPYTIHRKPYTKRLVSLLVAEVFLFSTILPAWATLLPNTSHLRPTASDNANRGDLVQELKTEAARDGGEKFIEKKEITFQREGRFAEGRAVFLDLAEVDLTLAYSEEVRRTDFFGRMPQVGFPLRQWVKDRSPLVAINGLQTDLRGPSGFFIVKGELIQKPTGVKGIRQAIYTPLNGRFSVFVLDGKPRVEKVSIRDNTLLTEGIQFALSGPPLLIHGEDVSRAIHERGEGSPLPVQDAEVAWDPEKITASFSAIGAKKDGRIVLLSMVGDPDRQREMYVWEVAEILKGLGVTDAILLGGSGDTQQYLGGDPEPFLLAKGRRGSMRPQAERPLGTAILVYPKQDKQGQLNVLKVEDEMARDGGEKENKEREDLIRKIEDLVILSIQKTGIRHYNVYLFGSVVWGEAPHLDIDILIDASNKKEQAKTLGRALESLGQQTGLNIAVDVIFNNYSFNPEDPVRGIGLLANFGAPGLSFGESWSERIFARIRREGLLLYKAESLPNPPQRSSENDDAKDGGVGKLEVFYGIEAIPFSQTISPRERILELSP